MTGSANTPLDPSSAPGRALRSLCLYKGPVGAGQPIVMGRRRSRPDAPCLALVRWGLATVETLHGVRMYAPTPEGRELAASWSSLHTVKR